MNLIHLGHRRDHVRAFGFAFGHFRGSVTVILLRGRLFSPPRRRERRGRKALQLDDERTLLLSRPSAQTRSDHLPADDHTKNDPEEESVRQSHDWQPRLVLSKVDPSRGLSKLRNRRPKKTQRGRCPQGRAHTNRQSVNDDADFLGRAQRHSLKHRAILAWASSSVKCFRSKGSLP